MVLEVDVDAALFGPDDRSLHSLDPGGDPRFAVRAEMEAAVAGHVGTAKRLGQVEVLAQIFVRGGRHDRCDLGHVDRR